MAEDPVAPRGRAANVSRRSVLGGIASTPLATSVRVVPNPSAWEGALKAYSAAHYRYEAFLATTLQPAYARYNADMARSPLREFADARPINVLEVRKQITAAERQIIEAGGGRTEIVHARRVNPELARLRSTLAAELRLYRTRARLMDRYDVFALEEEGNGIRAMQMDALRELLAVPAIDRAAMLLKVRLSYQEIFRHEDRDGSLAAVFADVERLCG